jgi:peroxiredoxin Q/BCP
VTSTKTDGLTVGQLAPDFTLPDGDGQEWRLAAQRGKVVVLLFYPGDETPVCTKQMCSVRDHWDEYVETGAEVVGISTNSVESHQQFAAHHRLPLRLLADTEGRVRALYGAKSLLPGRTARAVFVIDAEGIVRYRDVRPIGLFRPRDGQTIAAIRQAQAAR